MGKDEGETQDGNNSGKHSTYYLVLLVMTSQRVAPVRVSVSSKSCGVWCLHVQEAIDTAQEKR